MVENITLDFGFCNVKTTYDFLLVWVQTCIYSLLIELPLALLVFKYYYVDITYEKWVYKIQPYKFPSLKQIQSELVTLAPKSIVVYGTIQVISLYLASNGYSKGYCLSNNEQEYPPYYTLVLQPMLIYVLLDLMLWCQHTLGHVKVSGLWKYHRVHHVESDVINPLSAFADHWFDTVTQKGPALILLPFIIPISMEVYVFVLVVFANFHGIMFHSGYESTILTSHNGIFATAYHHHIHHKMSHVNKSYYNGFLLFWDYLAGTYLPKDKCQCITCRRSNNKNNQMPLRTREEFDALVIPDYMGLFSFNGVVIPIFSRLSIKTKRRSLHRSIATSYTMTTKHHVGEASS